MSLLYALRARLRALLFRRAADRDLREEIGYHLDRETDKYLSQGASRDEARRLAVAHFGGVERVREDHRDVRRFRWVEDFAADTRFALRALRRSPALSGTAVITLALGIGANVAIFSAVNAVVLEPLPFPHADRLMVVTEENPEKHWHLNIAAPANLLDWRAGVADFEDVTGYLEHPQRATLTGRGDPQILNESYAMGNLFSVLGARAAMGRTLEDAENWQDPKSTTHVLVLSDKAWRTHFAADPAVVGKSAVIDGQTLQIVGVMPPSFSFPDETVDLWRTFEWDPAQRAGLQFRRGHYLRAVARLRPGATEAHANAELQSVVDRLKHDYPSTNKYMGALMMPMHDFLVGDTRLPLLVLLTSVGFLLLIACANVGNLLLVQAAGREREAAVRLALGAGRARLVRQALTESLVLSVIGSSVGLALGWAGTRAFVRLQPNGLLRVRDFGVDGVVLGYVVAITVASALIFGIAPALWSRHRSPAESLKEGGRGAAQGGRAKRWGETLVVAEVALALLMTVGAGLLVRSFIQLVHVDPGFDPHGVLAAGVSVDAKYDTSTKVDAFMRQLQVRLGAVPGVTGAALASNTPFAGTGYTADFIVYGWPDGKYATEVGNRTVSSSYFATMKVPVLSGRTFGPQDRDGSTRVIVINQALSDEYFKGENPVGQQLAFTKAATPTTQWYTIVGVVGSEHVDGLGVPPRIEAFHAEAQEPSGYMVALLRTAGDPASLAPSVRSVLHDLDPSLALLDVNTLDTLRGKSLAKARFFTMLLLVFAVIGLTLSVVGVYGVLAQTSRNRTREMGIRIALGAQAAQVRWLVVRQGLTLTIYGLVVGGILALFGTKVMTNLLFQVAPNDPLTLAAVALLLAATSILAAWLPALKASRADPASALRAD